MNLDTLVSYKNLQIILHFHFHGFFVLFFFLKSFSSIKFRIYNYKWSDKEARKIDETRSSQFKVPSTYYNRMFNSNQSRKTTNKHMILTCGRSLLSAWWHRSEHRSSWPPVSRVLAHPPWQCLQQSKQQQLQQQTPAPSSHCWPPSWHHSSASPSPPRRLPPWPSWPPPASAWRLPRESGRPSTHHQGRRMSWWLKPLFLSSWCQLIFWAWTDWVFWLMFEVVKLWRMWKFWKKGGPMEDSWIHYLIPSWVLANVWLPCVVLYPCEKLVVGKWGGVWDVRKLIQTSLSLILTTKRIPSFGWMELFLVDVMTKRWKKIIWIG